MTIDTTPALEGLERRVESLLTRMTLAEKAGLMFHTMVFLTEDGQVAGGGPFGVEDPVGLILDKHITHFNVIGSAKDARTFATWHNRLQEIAATGRLAVPITLSSDPRHHFTDNPGTGFLAGAFSQWPETLGLAALRSPELVERFADVARQEYVAVGLRAALHPQIDLSTEPRWARINATFGEDATLTSELVAAYIRGFQGAEFGPRSVSTMTKHFPGGGPQRDGEDPHFAYGREQVYPGGRFEHHLEPFRAAIAAGARQMMPYYGMPVGTEYEEVGFGFNRGVITGILRDRLGFDGIVCTDWGLVHDVEILGEPFPARAWGVEHLDPLARVQKIIEAGCDQLGGEAAPELVVQLVEEGRISEARIDESARRLLREKVLLGLFDDPFVDQDAAAGIVGRPDFVELGRTAQRESMTLLTNGDDVLPLRRVPAAAYVEGVARAVVEAAGMSVVDRPEEADIALLRLKAPYEARPGAFESLMHAGSLEYPEEELARLAAIFAAVPTVVDVYLDRPAIIPEIAAGAAAVLVDFGTDDEAFLDVVLGRAEPRGRLPFDLPSSMAAVVASAPDVPFDTADPLFRFGHGLRY